jgi:drug/metabolite transporter (DMT)-like permease
VGAAQTVFATSLRKACSLALSYFLFPKPFTFQHFMGVVLVTLGTYFNTRANKNAAKAVPALVTSPTMITPEEVKEKV